MADTAPTRNTKQISLAINTADTEAAFDLSLRGVIFCESNEMATTRSTDDANEKSRKASGQKITSSSGARDASGLTVVPKMICLMSSRLTPAPFATGVSNIAAGRGLVRRASVVVNRVTLREPDVCKPKPHLPAAPGASR